MKPTLPQKPKSDSIRDRVFSTIDEQNVEPTPCYVFWCQNSAMWMVWLLTVLLGALATAVLVFTSTYRYYDIYEAMHDNFVTFFFQALPVLWIVAFIILMVVAMRGLRATRRGYRLSPSLVGVSSVGASVLLGVIASSLGFGFIVDRTLGEYAPMYYSEAEREQKMWQQPREGRLIGHANGDGASELTQITFVDSTGANWAMDIQELRPEDKQLLRSEQQVRVLGEQLEGTSGRFHACGVFPWMLDKKRPMKELSAGRKESVEKMYQHSPKDRLLQLEQLAFSDARVENVPSMKICAEIAAVRRIADQMQ
jgi:hypothetical protein